MDTNTLGYLIKKKRKEKHLTQQELADKLYVSSTTISKWENGNSRPDLEKLKSISSVLDIPLPLLLGMDSAETDESTERTATSEMASTEEGTVTERTPSADEGMIHESETAINEIQTDVNQPEKKLPRKKSQAVAILSAAGVFLIFTVVFFLYSQAAAPAENADFKVLYNYHGSYLGLDACCVIVKCDEKNTQETCTAHAEEYVREAYSPCFEEVEVITVFYLSDDSRDVDLAEDSLYIITLFPLHDFEVSLYYEGASCIIQT